MSLENIIEIEVDNPRKEITRPHSSIYEVDSVTIADDSSLEKDYDENGKWERLDSGDAHYEISTLDDNELKDLLNQAQQDGSFEIRETSKIGLMRGKGQIVSINYTGDSGRDLRLKFTDFYQSGKPMKIEQTRTYVPLETKRD